MMRKVDDPHPNLHASSGADRNRAMTIISSDRAPRQRVSDLSFWGADSIWFVCIGWIFCQPFQGIQ